MNTADIVVLVVLIASGVFALVRGFVHEVLAVTGWVLAPLAAFWAVRRVPAVHEFAHRFVAKDWIADIGAGVAIFLVVLICLSIITHAVARRVQRSALGSVDRVLGFGFGLVRGLVLCSLAYMVVVWMLPTPPDMIRDAKTLPLVQRCAALIQALVPEHLALVEEKAKEAAQAAEELKQGKDALDEFNKLQQPQPQAPAQGDAAKLPNVDSKALERLIENTNGK